MTSRGQITNKWARVCIGCGKRVHITQLPPYGDTDTCPQCGDDRWTRDKTKVER